MICIVCVCVFFFKQKTAYELRISDWSSDVCSSDLLPFRKMHGHGNDFVVIDARTRPVELPKAAIRAIADRRRGVGFDQLFVLEPPGNGGDVFMRIFNADGGEVSSCGNGTRCVASLIMAESGTGRALVDRKSTRLNSSH